jgi:tetratricopeptide (TPR) repeat protein
MTAQLIDCNTGKHVWAERYDRNLDDIFSLQDEIVSDILTGLEFNLPSAAVSQKLRKPTSSSSAYTALLQARAAWYSSDEESALAHFRRAIEIDPEYAEALADLASMWAYSYFSGASRLSSIENKRLTREYGARALRADDQNANVLASVALAKCMTGETAEARPLIAAAREMMPRDPNIMMIEGTILAYSGEHQRALTMMETAVRREPRLPITFKMAMAEARYLARDYQRALQVYDSVFDMPWYAALMRSACLGQLGQSDTARMAAASALAMAPATVDPKEFPRKLAAMCVLDEDSENWLEGFRKVGFAV